MSRAAAVRHLARAALPPLHVAEIVHLELE